MRLSLTDQVHGVLVEGDLVLLDVAADAYYCLPAGDQSLVLEGRRLDVTPDLLAQALCEAGLAAPLDALADPPSPMGADWPTRTARAIIEADPAIARRPARWRHLSALIRAGLTARRAQRRVFAERLQPRASAIEPLSLTLLADLAIYRRLWPWAPFDGVCLFRSEMLRTYLRCLGHDATWVFAVRTWPFSAHCWLQVGDVALDDEAERLAAYHPILAV